jgi:hypothetical protein
MSAMRRITPIPFSGATVLWIEANPVFGGSMSQVQFPVELSGFFSLPQNPSIGDYTEIGVCAYGIDFQPKKMDFHHNQMWRLNLPTAKQGLGGYENTILVFEKTEDIHRYRLWIVDAGSITFKRLRMASRTGGKIGSTTREDGSQRWFGYH